MASVASTFKTHEPSLPELLDDIHKGTIQLPDFQRGWVWDDDRIRALIASVSLSYPIGAVMLMETGDAGLRFKPRLVEGVPSMNGTKPEKLILDGQQRLTSLYTSLRSGQPVKTLTSKKRGKRGGSGTGPILEEETGQVRYCWRRKRDRSDIAKSGPRKRSEEA